MSNPPTHVPMARPRSQGSHPARPPAASQPPTGATAIASPRNSWVYDVNRFASEYQNTIASATGDRTRQIVPNRDAQSTNSADATTTKPVASDEDIRPRGSS